MKVLGDICAPTGTYTGQDGQEKTRWGKCGVLMQNADGNYRIKLDLLPFAGDGWLAVFERQDKPKPAPAPQQLDDVRWVDKSGNEFIDPDVPF